MVDPLSSFVISVLANSATSWGSKISQKGVETKVKDAFTRALKKWTKHDVEWDSLKFKERLVDLVDYMQNPAGRPRCASDIQLLDYYKTELRKDPEVWSVIEELRLDNVTALLQDTHGLVNKINTFVEQHQVSQEELTNSINRLLDLQLRRNVSSGKYLKDTYLEVDKVKEKLRNFVDPFSFYQLARDKTRILNFDNLRWKLKEKGEGEFEFDVNSVVGDTALPKDFGLLYEASRRLTEFLSVKHSDLYNGGNTRFFSARKIKDVGDNNICIHKRVLILTSKAGQGKTNLLCDLTNNVILKRGILAAYLNGYELSSDSVEETFVRKLFPTKHYSLDDVLLSARCYCESNKVPFVLIIDGLNENASPKELKESMENFLSTVLQYDFVKVIVSCRTEYYDMHFLSIGKLFEDDTILLRDINSRLNDHWEKLKELYFDYFSIVCSSISDEIRNEFCNNLLLFRIFCEVNAGRQLYSVHSIAKEPLFAEYCSRMIQRVTEELVNDGYKSATDSLIVGFLQELIGRMVEKDTFSNIPLSTICLYANAQQQAIINRFLDNNVLVRKDLMPDNTSPFKNAEVVNFTFDEFRDYLVSHYLVDTVLSSDRALFNEYVYKYTNTSHLLSEGLTAFLFSYVKRVKAYLALDELKSQPWYERVFTVQIWDVDEDDVDEDDIYLINKLLAGADKHVAQQLVYWGRWNTEKFPKLNIRLLLKHLAKLRIVDLSTFFDSTWPTTPTSLFHRRYGWKETSQRKQFLDKLRAIVERKGASSDYGERRNLFEVLLYMVVIDSAAFLLYDEYMRNVADREQVRKVLTETSCIELKALVSKWL